MEFAKIRKVQLYYDMIKRCYKEACYASHNSSKCIFLLMLVAAVSGSCKAVPH